MHPEFFRERYDVVAALQALDRHLPECVGVPPNSSFPSHSSR